MTMLRVLGKIAGMLVKAASDEAAYHDDVSLFGAPSECHRDVRRGCRKHNTELVEAIEIATGYTASELRDELTARCSGKWLYHNGVLAVLDEVIDDREEAEEQRQRQKYAMGSFLPGGTAYHIPRHIP